MTRIILIGYMGAGKTTLGKELAKRLGLTFYDLDWFIERRFCKTINELFAERGEDGFRKLEREMLREVAEMEDVVISAGGGTPCFFDNIDIMNRQSETVYLKASPETLFAHLQKGKHKRPLLRDKSDDELKTFITESLAKREPYYMQARHIFETTILFNQKQVELAVERLEKQLAVTI